MRSRRRWLRGAVTPRGPVTAGARGRWTFALEVLRPLRAGASLRWGVPLGWTPPGLVAGSGRVRWQVIGDALVLAEVVRRRSVRFNITGGRLDPGDRLLVMYGGGRGAAAQPWVTDEPARFELAVSPDGSEAFLEQPDIAVRVQPAAPARLHVVVPSTLAGARGLPVGVTVLDQFGNLCPAVSGPATVDVVVPDRRPGAGRPSRATLTIRGGRGEAEVPLHAHGAVRARVRMRRPRLDGVSNPCLTHPLPWPGPLWGDPHVHTTLSDGAGSAVFALAYARQVARLDFAAITDHDLEYHHAWFARPRQHLDEADWRALQRAAASARVPGRFAVLRAYEWTGRPYGDRCVYFRTDRAAALHRCEPDDAPTPEALAAVLARRAGDDVVVVPHTSASSFMGAAWTGRDLRPERAVEIYSMHGSSEHPDAPLAMPGGVRGRWVADALRAGRRLGFVAGGDMHSSQPGNPLLAVGPYRTLRFKAGLTGAFAAAATEDAVFDALARRRTYATTGARILLWTSVHGAPMGQEVVVPVGEGVVVEAAVVGTARIAEVAVIRDGRPVHVHRPGRTLEAAMIWRDEASRRLRRPLVYYVRVVQADGEVAWASPVWVRRSP